MMTTDTICAIATAAGEAGLAVLRISGPESLTIANRVFTGKGSDLTPGTFVHGTVHAPDKPDEHIDEGLLLIFK